MSERAAKTARNRIAHLVEYAKPEAIRLNERGNAELLINGEAQEFRLNKAERRAVRQYMDRFR
jgi:hypothetical protein